MKKINYLVHRDNIKSGQLVFIGASRHHKNTVQTIIQKVTKGEYTHTGITVWMQDEFGHRKLMILESTLGGVRLVNMSSYLDRKTVLADLGIDWQHSHDTALSKAGFVKYGFVDFNLIGLRELLVRHGFTGIARKLPDGKGEVCSEFLAHLLNDDPVTKARLLEMQIDHLETLVSPSKLLQNLLDLGLVNDLVELTLDDTYR